MQVDQLATVIVAATTNANVNAARRFERAPSLVRGKLYAAGSAAGLTCELNVGGRSITPPTTVNAQNRLPVVPDDLLAGDWYAAAGELIQITVVNTTGGNLTFNHRIELEEVELVEG
jgi:hypothetical protein